MLAHVLLFVLAVIGIGETAYLIYKRIVKERPVCVIGKECHRVLESKYNKILGIPNEIPGLIFFIAISLVTAFLVIEWGPVIWWDILIKLLILGATLLSLYFVYLQWRVIKVWCFWCVSSAVLVFAMLLVVLTGDLPMIESEKSSPSILQGEASRSEDVNKEITPALETSLMENNEAQEVPTVPQSILLDVPFTSQAPFAQWSDVVYQNACEEASIVMVMRWAKGKSLTKEEATKEIVAIADFEQKMYGHFHDRSASDTAQLIIDYYGYLNIEFQSDIDTDDIKIELAKGNAVIVPVNGQKLNNPFYTPLGPIEHMIVVIGYDSETKEFITNDPGTRRGGQFRYSEDVLDAALRDYATGFHEPITQINKVMIIVRPNF